MVTACVSKDKAEIVNSVKQNKAKADIIQQLKVNLEAQISMLEDERKVQQKSFEAIKGQLAQLDERNSTKTAKIKTLTEEIERRKFMEEKVQTYVKSLCL